MEFNRIWHWCRLNRDNRWIFRQTNRKRERERNFVRWISDCRINQMVGLTICGTSTECIFRLRFHSQFYERSTNISFHSTFYTVLHCDDRIVCSYSALYFVGKIFSLLTNEFAVRNNGGIGFAANVCITTRFSALILYSHSTSSYVFFYPNSNQLIHCTTGIAKHFGSLYLLHSHAHTNVNTHDVQNAWKYSNLHEIHLKNRFSRWCRVLDCCSWWCCYYCRCHCCCGCHWCVCSTFILNIYIHPTSIRWSTNFFHDLIALNIFEQKYFKHFE